MSRLDPSESRSSFPGVPEGHVTQEVKRITLEATVIRRDGTREDLGEVASTDDGSIRVAKKPPSTVRRFLLRRGRR